MSILRTFKALDADYQIKFITHEYFDECVKFANEYFITDEAMCRVRNFRDDKEAMEENNEQWMKILRDEKISIACFKVDGDQEILVGVNFLYVKRKSSGDDDVEIKSKTLRDIFTAMNLAEQQVDVFAYYKVEEYLASIGLSVHPQYRGRGIAVEMLKARKEILRILGLKLTSTQFTGDGSQRSAVKAGYEENSTVTYDDLFKMNNELYFPGIETHTIKTMSLRVD